LQPAFDSTAITSLRKLTDCPSAGVPRARATAIPNTGPHRLEDAEGNSVLQSGVRIVVLWIERKPAGTTKVEPILRCAYQPGNGSRIVAGLELTMTRILRGWLPLTRLTRQLYSVKLCLPNNSFPMQFTRSPP